MHSLFISVHLACFLCLLLFTPAMATKIQHRSTIYDANVNDALRHPEGVACSSDSSFIVADTGNSRIVRYAMTETTLIPDGVFPLPNSSPLIVQSDSNGSMYILDGKTRTVVKMDRDGRIIGNLEPTGLPAPQNFIPRSIKLDQENNIYLLDILSERILVLSPTGVFTKQLPFPDGYRFFSDLAITTQGAIYLLDSVAGAIYLAEPGDESFELLNSELKEHMNFPVSLAVDKVGTLFVSDQNGSGLVQLGRDGSFMGRKFGMGWEDGQFYYPAQLCINNQNILVMADRNNSRVQIFTIFDE